MMALDVAPEDLKTVKAILARYVPKFTVLVFGSRVKNTAKKFSDLDLAIITDRPLDVPTYTDLKEAFSHSDLPFKVDLVDWSLISEDFKKIIQEQSIEVQRP